MNISELMELMGNEATEQEAQCMADMLIERGILTIEQVRDMPSREFFALIPDCVTREDVPHD